MQQKSQRKTQASTTATNQNSLPVFACARLPALSAGPSPAVLECSWQTNKSLRLSLAKDGRYRKARSGKGIQQWLWIPMQQWQNPWFSPAFTGARLANGKLLRQSGLCFFKQTRTAVHVCATEKGKAGCFGVSVRVSADAEWQQRQTAGYSPVLDSEQGNDTAGLWQSMFYGSVSLLECTLLQARFQCTFRLHFSPIPAF